MRGSAFLHEVIDIQTEMLSECGISPDLSGAAMALVLNGGLFGRSIVFGFSMFSDSVRS